MSTEDNTNQNIELAPQADASSEISERAPVYQQLKPADRGLHAWRVLMTAFAIEALLWGFPVCFGVFQEHYSQQPEFAGRNVAVIGTVAQGICYLGAPLSTALSKRYPNKQQLFIWTGWALCIVALGAGSVSDGLTALIATQGLLYGIGFVVLYWPIMSIVNEWWIARKGFAFGLIVSAGGAAGAILPFIFQTLLTRYGHKITLRATAIAIVILTGPLIPFCKSRLPVGESTATAKMDWSFTSSFFFWTCMLSTIVQGFGLFFPSIFLPSYASDVGLGGFVGALLLSVMAISQFCGQCIFGLLSDKAFSVSLLAASCSLTASLAVFFLWGFGSSLPVLLLFSAVYGFFAYGFISVRLAMAKRISSDPVTLVALQSILNASSGWGNIMVGPLSTVLLTDKFSNAAYGAQKYQALIILTGSCMFGSALILLIAWSRGRAF